MRPAPTGLNVYRDGNIGTLEFRGRTYGTSRKSTLYAFMGVVIQELPSELILRGDSPGYHEMPVLDLVLVNALAFLRLCMAT